MNEVYENRINRVVDYIQANLDTPLSINQLSKIACFSEFHFNRTFKKAMGESAYQFIRRLRLEKSADLLLTKPEIPITEIAMVCGFATSSSFAKSFKEHFHMSATEWRNCSNAHFDKESQTIEVDSGRFSFVNGSPSWIFHLRGSIRQVVIEDIAPLTVAYVRNVGPYKGDDTLFDQLYAQLFHWAVPHGFVHEKTFTLNIYHDNPVITDRHKLRVMVAIPVESAARRTGSIGVTRIAGGKYGVCRFLLKNSEFMEAWDWMFSVWLNNSGYAKDDRDTFERCRGEQIINGKRFYDVDICIPVKAR